jgi:hypothetical protein
MVSEVPMLLRIATTVVTLILAITSTSRVHAASPEAALDRTLHTAVPSYRVESENLLQALAKFSDDFHVPIGIEWQLSKVPYGPIKLRYERTTVIQILEDMVATEPAYTLSPSNGVMHVSRVTTLDDSRNFLNIPIGDFELSSEYVFHANNRLRHMVLGLANVASHQTELGCAGSFGVGSGDQLASFHLHNVVVRDVLDRFVTSAGFNIWLVTFPEIPAVTGKGFFKSVSIFSLNLPDSELPAWDLLLPGYDPVRKQMGVGWKQAPWTAGTKPGDGTNPGDRGDVLQIP